MAFDIVARIYDAAMGQDEWADVVERIRDHVNADILFLGAGDPSAPEDLEHWGAGWDWALYEKAGYQSRDTWDPSINPAISAGMIMPIERSFDHRQFIPEETLLASEFIQRTVNAAGYTENRLFVPMRDASVLSGGVLSKSNNRAFDKEECDRFDALLPHLGRAMRMRQQIARHKDVERGLSDLLDRMEKAVFLIDRNMKVLFLNGVADDLARRADGISVRRGRLSLAQATQDLRKALAEIEADRLSPGNPPVIPIVGPPEMATLVARVYPGIGFADVPHASRVFASVIVETPREALLPDPTDLRSTFGLTPAEAAVARLVPAGSPRRAIAETLGLQENTVKTHLASIRAKTGAGNMVELAMILQKTTGP